MDQEYRAKLAAKIQAYSEVNLETGCWEWQRYCYPNGYGGCSIHGKSLGAHRVSFFVFNGEIPDGLCVCHTCDVRNCVNPNHLFLGTQYENLQDAKNKNWRLGRKPGNPSSFDYLRGEKQHNAKLIADDVFMIRKMAELGYAHQFISEQFNVGRAQISRIIRRERWTHI